MAHALDRRLDRLEAARPDAAGDLRRLVLLAFGHRNHKALGIVLPRLRKALGIDERPTYPLRLDPQAIARNDPEFREAMAALPKEVKAHVIARAEHRFGEPMSAIIERVGLRWVDGRIVMEEPSSPPGQTSQVPVAKPYGS